MIKRLSFSRQLDALSDKIVLIEQLQELRTFGIHSRLFMTIIKTTVPAQSLLKTKGTPYHYADSFEGTFADGQQRINVVEIGRIFFSCSPEWVDQLFAIRNRAVGFFGLKTSKKTADRRQVLDKLRFDCGDQFGLFRVFDRTENEVILGADDKHLNFRVSLLLTGTAVAETEKRLNVSTTVVFNNYLGRIYFAFVKPLHRMIVPTLLKTTIKKLNNDIPAIASGKSQ